MYRSHLLIFFDSTYLYTPIQLLQTQYLLVPGSPMGMIDVACVQLASVANGQCLTVVCPLGESVIGTPLQGMVTET